MRSLPDLSGTVVAVTGAGGGIGSGIARRFADASASLVLHYHKSRNAAERLADELSASMVEADIASPEGGEAIAAAAVERYGRLDVLINCAGVQPVQRLAEMSLEQWRAVIDTNLTGTFLCTQAAARHMIERGGGGAIIHIASIEGSQPAFLHAHYAASKAALIMHARAAALEYGPHGIRVNTVSPGLIDRPGLDADWPEGVGRWMRAVPLGRLGTAKDVGDACVFLASPMGSWITGIDLVVDGGVLTHSTW
jgi:NAD(P)-dependent dehydrogenase (short-subunit alcohol dehydrogenase family)